MFQCFRSAFPDWTVPLQNELAIVQRNTRSISSTG